jgi:hypothetical protein
MSLPGGRNILHRLTGKSRSFTMRLDKPLSGKRLLIMHKGDISMRTVIRATALALLLSMSLLIPALAEDTFLPSFQTDQPSAGPSLDEMEGVVEGTLSSDGTADSSSVAVGDVLCLGQYEQDGSSPGKRQPIEWIVLDKADGKLFLIAKKGLETGAFNKTKQRATWAECSLREWLNNDFIKKAFKSDEQACILTTNVKTPAGSFTSPATGEKIKILKSADTKDKLFLLNVAEVKKYFPEESQRMTPNNSYLFNKPMDSLPYPAENTGDDYAYGNWWLRDIRADKGVSCVFHVKSYGKLASAGQINLKRYVIRPAMWVDETYFK